MLFAFIFFSLALVAAGWPLYDFAGGPIFHALGIKPHPKCSMAMYQRPMLACPQKHPDNEIVCIKLVDVCNNHKDCWDDSNEHPTFCMFKNLEDYELMYINHHLYKTTIEALIAHHEIVVEPDLPAMLNLTAIEKLAETDRSNDVEIGERSLRLTRDFAEKMKDADPVDPSYDDYEKVPEWTGATHSRSSQKTLLEKILKQDNRKKMLFAFIFFSLALVAAGWPLYDFAGRPIFHALGLKPHPKCSMALYQRPMLACPQQHPDDEIVCIELVDVCNNHKDCWDGSDEHPTFCMFKNLEEYEVLYINYHLYKATVEALIARHEIVGEPDHPATLNLTAIEKLAETDRSNDVEAKERSLRLTGEFAEKMKDADLVDPSYDDYEVVPEWTGATHSRPLQKTLLERIFKQDRSSFSNPPVASLTLFLACLLYLLLY